MMIVGIKPSVKRRLVLSRMFDNTFFVFTSDNGPVWFQEDVDRYRHRSVGQLRGMKGDVWEGGHRVPFIVRWPGKVTPGSTSDALICFTDMLSTFAALTGQDLPEETELDSVNLLPLLLGESNDAPRDTLLHTGRRVLAVRQGAWKLIPGLGSYGFSEPKREKPVPGGPQGQLYNLAEDPGEKNNLWLDHPEIVRQLTKLLEGETTD